MSHRTSVCDSFVDACGVCGGAGTSCGATGTVDLVLEAGANCSTSTADASVQELVRQMLADALGVDPGAIALCGDSAGGAICVSVVALAARAGPPLRHLGLFYPALDPSCSSASHLDFADGSHGASAESPRAQIAPSRCCRGQHGNSAIPAPPGPATGRFRPVAGVSVCAVPF